MLPVAKPQVIFKEVADGAVLLDTEQEVYFGLNAVGAQVWQLLAPACSSIDEVCNELARRYPDAEAATIRADLVELLDDLETSGLVAVPRQDEKARSSSS